VSKHDSPALLAPAPFWGLLPSIIFYVIKATKGKRKKGGRATLHAPCHACGIPFSLCILQFLWRGFYEKHMCKSASAYPLVTPLLSAESAVFDVRPRDPQRRLGSSLNTASLVQNTRQHWIPACAGDHGKGWADLGRDIPMSTRQLSEDSAVFAPLNLRVFASSRELKNRAGALWPVFSSSREDAKSRRGTQLMRCKLAEDSGIFPKHPCDPQRRLGPSLNTASLVQTTRQHWTPAFVGDHGESRA
jgi:hypothetical protein